MKRDTCPRCIAYPPFFKSVFGSPFWVISFFTRAPFSTGPPFNVDMDTVLFLQSSKDTIKPIICLQITIHTFCPPRSPMLFHHLTAKCVETNEIVIAGRYSNSLFRDNLVERPIFISMTYLQVALLYWSCPLQSIETSFM